MQQSRALRQRRPRVRDAKHLALIRRLPCLVCFRNPPNEAAHVRYGEPDRGKPMTGVAEKPDDKWTLPLCGEHHRWGSNAQHKSGERQWWADRGIDPIIVCEALYACKTQEDIDATFLKLSLKMW